MFLSLVPFADLGEFQALSNPHSYASLLWRRPHTHQKVLFKALTQDLLLRRTNIRGRGNTIPPRPREWLCGGDLHACPLDPAPPGPGNRIGPPSFIRQHAPQTHTRKSLQAPIRNSHASTWQEVLHVSLVLSIHPFSKYLLSTNYVQVLCWAFILHRHLELTLWWT